MFSLLTDFDFKSVWLALSRSNKEFFLFFCGVSIYTFSLSIYALFRLHSFKKQLSNEGASVSTFPLSNLRKRLGNLRQLHLFTLYLFWFCVVANIPRAFETFGLSKTLPFSLILGNLAFLFHYDAPIFLAFLLLHSVQWFVSARVDSFAGPQSG